jgi:hypothetical protein
MTSVADAAEVFDRASRRLRIFAFVLLACATAAAVFWARAFVRDRHLREHGITTQAVVGEYRIFRGTPNLTRFDYEVRNRRYSAWVDTHHEDRFFPSGASVPFVYDPGHPEQGRPLRGYVDGVPLFGAAGVGLIAFGLLAGWRSAAYRADAELSRRSGLSTRFRLRIALAHGDVESGVLRLGLVALALAPLLVGIDMSIDGPSALSGLAIGLGIISGLFVGSACWTRLWISPDVIDYRHWRHPFRSDRDRKRLIHVEEGVIASQVRGGRVTVRPGRWVGGQYIVKVLREVGPRRDWI